MFEFTDSERAYLIEQRAISEDEQGHEVLVGLTFEETSFYICTAERLSQEIVITKTPKPTSN